MTNDSVANRLERTREELLDLTLRNRLLNTPRHQSRAKALEVVDERSDEVFARLVRERKAMYFLPAAGESAVAAEPQGAADETADEPDGEPTLVDAGPELPQPELDEGQEGVAARHRDGNLQSELASEKLQSRLLSLFYDARTIEQEQGVAILYLALGFLKWYEDDTSQKVRYAPLLLIPVALERTSVRSRFRLELADDAICANLSLETKLKSQFGIVLPEVDEGDDWTPSDYFARVAAAIKSQPRWSVCPDDVVLGLFSFAKFLLYRDLATDAWPAGNPIDQHPLVGALLGAGEFPAQPAFGADGDDLDALLDPLDMTHVVDADSSQAAAIEEVRRGSNLVIQGPPGTGKSQTITNLIAAAVQDGKTVLFVAEKMAALEVVKRRLDQVGLGNVCLELHSQKAKKTAVLDQLRTALEAPLPPAATGERETGALRSARELLNDYVVRLHERHEPSQLSAYEALGELIALRGTGNQATDFELPAAATWTPAERNRREELVGRCATLLSEIGLPAEHPWRGLGLAVMLPSDTDRLTGRLAPVGQQLQELDQQARKLAESLHLEPPATLGASDRLVMAAQAVADSPDLDSATLTNGCWKNRRAELVELVRQGARVRAAQAALREEYSDAAWTADVTATRRELIASGRHWYRWLIKSYREARQAYRNLCRNVPVGGPTQWVDRLDTLIAGQEAAKQLSQQQELGRQGFGTLWRGADSDWKALEQITNWIDRLYALGAEKYLEHPLAAAGTQPCGTAADQLHTAVLAARREIESVCATLKLDLTEAFGGPASPGNIAWRCPACGRQIKAAAGWLGKQHSCPGCGTLHDCGVVTIAGVGLTELRERFDQWLSAAQRASEWIAYRMVRDELTNSGLGDLVDRLRDGRVTAPEGSAAFRRSCLEAVLRSLIAQWPELARFQGRIHEQQVADFCCRDREVLQFARRQVARRHAERIPRAAAKDDQLNLIRHEINKKRRHLAVRRLLTDAGDVAQQIKPVFMMSPMSIAQFLAPGRLKFDLLVMDEASQVRPADSLGAIARAGQIVIVGDDQQLPPTRFFSALVGDDFVADDETDAADARDLESILGLCNARGLANRMLRWHYRSRHHSLIAVSNREFYGGELIVVPSPQPRSPELGVSFQQIANGVFDRGGTATNRVEAQAVAAAVMQHALERPGNSLGVGCFSVAQRDMILDELEVLRRNSSAGEAFFSGDLPEPFFVKNLENIQGDERDEIYISVGYGRDASGKLTMNFGPLSAEGGQRRLNVLITRARRRSVVFSSIVADDIDLSRVSGRGPQVLKHYLEYCQVGAREVPQSAADTGRAPFERYLAKCLAEAGENVLAQVGVTGLYIDLGIVDPATAATFCLGIECDGPNYRAARWARDRDRLRGQVLADHGWKLLRIWTPDWFYRPDDELRRVLAAIAAARQEAAQQIAK